MKKSKKGKVYNPQHLKHIPDSVILVEAAMRRGQSMSTLIKPSSPSLARIDLARWKSAYLAAKNVDFPNRNLIYEVFDNIMIDLDLSSVIETRVLNVQQSKFVVYDKNNKQQEELTLLFERQWFQDFIKYAMESRFEGFRLIEFFEFKDDGEIAKCTVVNKYHVKPEKGIVTKEANDDKGFDYLNGPISQFYIPVGNTSDLGILYKVAPNTLAKKYALGTWAEFNEKMGIPFRTVHTNVADTKRQNQLAIIMENMGSAGWAVLNNEEKVELLNTNGTDPTKCFDGLINKLDASVANYILGQSATSNSANNKGTYGSMKILQEITQDRHEADLQFMKNIINDVLIPRMVTWGYKLDGAYLDWDKSIELTIAETVGYVVSLSSVYDIPADFVTQKTGIPITGIKKSTFPSLLPTGAVKKKILKVKSVNRLTAALYSETCGCDNHPVVITAGSNEFQKLVADVAKKLYDGKQTGIIDYPLIKATAAQLREALTVGYKTPDNQDFDSKDYEMLFNLEKNVYVFSAFKNYQQLRSITDLLKDENGNVRSFSDFKQRAIALNDIQNVNYLKTEYNHALKSASMASQWVDIQRNIDVLPYLQFDATMDDRTTDICQGLEGVTLPVDDEFWDTYYLPLHWHERSVIRQIARGKVTDKETIAAPDLQPMFKNNVGKTGVAFPASHPYFETSKVVNKELYDTSNKQYIYSKPREQQFESIYKDKKTGAEVLRHTLANKTKDDYLINFEFAKAQAKLGNTYEILPEVHQSEKEARVSIFPDLKSKTRNPDLRDLTGVYLDIKRPQSYKQIVHNINSATHQNSIAVITDDYITLTNDIIDEKCKVIFSEKNRIHYPFDVVYFFRKGKVIIKNRKGDK